MDKMVHGSIQKANENDCRVEGLKPALLLRQHWKLFAESGLREPVMDLACGDGHNGIFLAGRGIPVVLIDRSTSRLHEARNTARKAGISIDIRQMDLERENTDPLSAFSLAGVIVFRYLHRPLIPTIREIIKAGGILIYETFTVAQRKYGRPRNPDHLLKSGELRDWFSDWEVLHDFEGEKVDPQRAVAQLVCRKPRL